MIEHPTIKVATQAITTSKKILDRYQVQLLAKNLTEKVEFIQFVLKHQTDKVQELEEETAIVGLLKILTGIKTYMFPKQSAADNEAEELQELALLSKFACEKYPHFSIPEFRKAIYLWLEGGLTIPLKLGKKELNLKNLDLVWDKYRARRYPVLLAVQNKWAEVTKISQQRKIQKQVKKFDLEKLPQRIAEGIESGDWNSYRDIPTFYYDQALDAGLITWGNDNEQSRVVEMAKKIATKQYGNFDTKQLGERISIVNAITKQLAFWQKIVTNPNYQSLLNKAA